MGALYMLAIACCAGIFLFWMASLTPRRDADYRARALAHENDRVRRNCARSGAVCYPHVFADGSVTWYNVAHDPLVL